jgi:selenocysteine-specific elongation factor
MTAPGPLTLGTAGHIDHGKTALVGALTGVDTDRLPEERERGISIALGYAPLTLPSGRRLSLVDVPGHERFVRTMVAGASGIDIALMVVAADDGVMPQTVEHAAVLRALGVGEGVAAVTKADLADPARAVRDVAELLPGVEAVPCSAVTGAGVAGVAAALDRVAARVPSRAVAPGPAVLHVDRSFTVKGIGTVVTGTLWSGPLSRGDEVELLPAGRRARVRGLQVHDQPVDEADAGQRVAVNLTGVAVTELGRGDVLASGDSALRPTYLIDAQLELSGPDPDPGARVQVHHGTRETAARTAWLGGSFWQLRLEHELIPAPGDRLVIRQIAPPDTLGGGVVLDAHPRKHGPSRDLLVRLERLARGESVSDEIRSRSQGSNAEPSESPPLSDSALALEQQLKQAGPEPPLDSELDPDDLEALRAAGRAVRVSKSLHYHPDTLAEIRERVVELAGRSGGSITLGALRDELGTSRKFAQALLEHFDAERLTIRRDDAHVLRSSVRGR